MKTISSLGSICGFVLALLPWAGHETTAQDFWIEAGPAVRGAMKVKVSGGSYVQGMGLHAAPAPLTEPASVGPLGAYADREYDDGYVRLDEGTLNPDAVGGPGNTWNWAYDSAGQFNPSANTLSYNRQGDVGYTTLRDVPVSGSDDMTGVGVQITAGWKVLEQDEWRLDLAIGFQGIWGASSKISRSSYMERTSRFHVTDTYNVADTVDEETGFPGPRTVPDGYAGQFNVPGPVITNVPATRTSARTDLSTAENRVDFDVETDFLEVTFSPRLTFAATPSLSLHLAPKLGASFIQVSADRTEVFTETTSGVTTTLGSWSDHESDSVVRFAAGITAGADVQLGKGYYAGVFGGYEWAVDDVRLSIGPNEVSVNGSGYVAGLVIGKRF